MGPMATRGAHGIWGLIPYAAAHGAHGVSGHYLGRMFFSREHTEMQISFSHMV